MKQLAFYTLLVFTLLSCGGSDNQFRLKGTFEHLEQGEFYLYSPDGGSHQIDTIRLRDGEFDYTATLAGEATYYLLYPNYSEHVIFARKGETVTMEADARSLKTTRIEGSKENEQYTEFRLKNQDLSQKEQLKAAADFIRQQPASRVSQFLFKKYYLNGAGAKDTQTTSQLYDMLRKAQPGNTGLTLWSNAISSDQKFTVGKKMPSIELPLPNGDTIRSENFRGRYLLLTFWAGWRSQSTSLLFHTRRLRRLTNDSLAAISYSLDVKPSLRRAEERGDTVDWPSYCSYNGWNDPRLQLWGIDDIPFSVFVDTAQVVIAQGSKFDVDILPHVKKVFHLK